MEIRISKPSRTCHKTEREFEHGEDVVSSVRLENEHFVRQDFAKDAWDAEAGEGAVAVWSMAYVDPRVAEAEPPESFSPLRQIFYEAVDGSDRVALATAYLAAELLRRQKVFKLLKQSDDPEEETKVALYNDKIGNRLVEVRDPHLTLRELEAGRTALVTRLNEIEGATEEGGEAEGSSGEEADAHDAEAPLVDSEEPAEAGEPVAVAAEVTDATVEEA